MPPNQVNPRYSLLPQTGVYQSPSYGVSDPASYATLGTYGVPTQAVSPYSLSGSYRPGMLSVNAPAIAQPVGSALGADNIDVGGGFNPAAGAAVTPPAYQPTLMETLTGWRHGDQAAGGVGGLALGGINALIGAYVGLGQLDVAKQSLAASKDQFERNFAAQQKSVNTRLEDRQRARVASNSGAYQSVGDYMNTNRV